MNPRTAHLHAAIGRGGPRGSCCNGGRFANGRASRRAHARSRAIINRIVRCRDERLALAED